MTDRPREDYEAGESEGDPPQLTQTLQIGRCMGYPVAVGPSRRPAEASAPDEFGVNVFVPDEDGENVDIVRVDTGHDGCHVDRLYLPDDDPKRRDYSRTFYSPEAVLEWLLSGDRLERMVRRYDEVHGLPRTAESSLEEE